MYQGMSAKKVVGNLTQKQWDEQCARRKAISDSLFASPPLRPVCPVCEGTGMQPNSIALRCGPCGGMGVKTR